MKNPGMRGNTEASTTRRLRVRCTRKSELNTPFASARTDLTGATGVVTPRVHADELGQLRIADDIVARQLFAGNQLALAELARHPADEPHAFDDRVQVGVAIRKVVEVDRRPVEWIGGAQRHGAGPVGGVALEHHPRQRVPILARTHPSIPGSSRGNAASSAMQNRSGSGTSGADRLKTVRIEPLVA